MSGTWWFLAGWFSASIAIAGATWMRRRHRNKFASTSQWMDDLEGLEDPQRQLGAMR